MALYTSAPEIASWTCQMRMQQKMPPTTNSPNAWRETTTQACGHWSWTATWKRTRYNTCDKVRAGGHMPEDNAEVALCCLPGSGEAEAEAEAEGEGEGEDENTERRLQEEDDAEAEAEGEDEAEEAYPKYGAELRDAMCGQSEENGTNGDGGETTPGSDEGGEQTPTESDPTGSASTFGFTALALMLVT